MGGTSSFLSLQIFLFPVKTTAIVPESTVQTMFSNVEIIQNVNKEFYQNLENRMKRHSEINATVPVGDLFKKMVLLQFYNSVTRSNF